MAELGSPSGRLRAYLADVFGVKYVSAVHGRLLTAWSAAGISLCNSL